MTAPFLGAERQNEPLQTDLVLDSAEQVDYRDREGRVEAPVAELLKDRKAIVVNVMHCMEDHYAEEDGANGD